MEEEQKVRLAEMLKEHHRSRTLKEWIAKLKQACDYVPSEDDFLELEHTRRLKALFYNKSGSLPHDLCWTRSPNTLQKLGDLITDICISVGQLPVILFSSVDDVIGATRLPASRVLAHFEEVWKVTEEDLSLATPNLQHGFRLEINFYCEDSEYVKEGVCELTTWGAFKLQA